MSIDTKKSIRALKTLIGQVEAGNSTLEPLAKFLDLILYESIKALSEIAQARGTQYLRLQEVEFVELLEGSCNDVILKCKEKLKERSKHDELLFIHKAGNA